MQTLNFSLILKSPSKVKKPPVCVNTG